jgi:hypothetical protein
MSTKRSIAASAALFTILSAPAGAWANGADDAHRVELHVGSEHESCYFDLHPELTEAELKTFAAEGGQMVRSRQMSSARTLGAGTLDVGLGYAYFFLDDTKGAWNNTMTHPDADHYLGEQLGVPQLEARLGVSARVDVEAYGTVNWMSNYGFVGLATKIALLREGERWPLSLAVRPSVAAMLGPNEIQAYNLSTDVAVSREIGDFSPFAGVTASQTLVIESSDDTDVGNTAAARALAFVGLEYRWRHLSAAAQAEVSDLTALALRVGGSF